MNSLDPLADFVGRQTFKIKTGAVYSAFPPQYFCAVFRQMAKNVRRAVQFA